MNTMELVHFVSTGERPSQRPLPIPAPHCEELLRPVRAAMVRARQFLLSAQRSDGAWLSPQTTDASLASQFIFLLAYRGDAQTVLAEQAAATILDLQSPGGGWTRAPGGPADLSISVQAYFALKLTGVAASDQRMARARVAIRQLGGADSADGITRYYLALFGQIDYDCCSVIRPELLLRERHRCISILAPLALVWSHRAMRPVSIERGVRELFIEHSASWPALPLEAVASCPRAAVQRRWLGTILDSKLSMLQGSFERFGWTPLRNRGLRRAESQLLQNIEPTHVSRLDFSALVWHAIALQAVGFSRDRGELLFCEEKINECVPVDDDLDRAQPRVRVTGASDTIAVLQSLAASGLAPHHPCAAAGIGWLRRHKKCARARLTAIDLACVLRAIGDVAGEQVQGGVLPDIQLLRHPAQRWRRVQGPVPSRLHRLTKLLVRQLIEQQDADGGWGVASGSRSVPDATAAVLEAISRFGPRAHGMSHVVTRGVNFLRRTQRADGRWDSATGVRYVHGTSLAVRGLLAAGVASEDDTVAAGINWLIVHQHPSGGWGETVLAGNNGDRGEFAAGPATASQTAWALFALVAAGRANSEAARRAIHFLLETQDQDGSWREVPFVHRDSEANLWFRSELHSVSEPLMALSIWRAATAHRVQELESTPLRLVGTTDPRL
jgi:squalene-hopene/tetraprenyl-beta-curcumene cyclase